MRRANCSDRERAWRCRAPMRQPSLGKRKLPPATQSWSKRSESSFSISGNFTHPYEWHKGTHRATIPDPRATLDRSDSVLPGCGGENLLAATRCLAGCKPRPVRRRSYRPRPARSRYRHRERGSGGWLIRCR